MLAVSVLRLILPIVTSGEGWQVPWKPSLIPPGALSNRAEHVLSPGEGTIMSEQLGREWKKMKINDGYQQIRSPRPNARYAPFFPSFSNSRGISLRNQQSISKSWTGTGWTVTFCNFAYWNNLFKKLCANHQSGNKLNEKQSSMQELGGCWCRCKVKSRRAPAAAGLPETPALYHCGLGADSLRKGSITHHLAEVCEREIAPLLMSFLIKSLSKGNISQNGSFLLKSRHCIWQIC